MLSIRLANSLRVQKPQQKNNSPLNTNLSTKWTSNYNRTTLLKRNFASSKTTTLPKEGEAIELNGSFIMDTGDFLITSQSPGAVGTSDKEPINMIADVPPIEVNGRRAVCDGGSGPLGHPRVFINLDKDKPISCGYCGLRFVQKHH